VRGSGRTILTEYESKRLLAAYGIPTGETRIAETAEEAVEASEAIGYPVVIKIHSETITHKTDVGGVILNLADADAVRQAFNEIKTNVAERVGEKDDSGQAHFLGVTVQPMIKLEGYEIILGSSIDPQFGPVLLFGMGGQLVEVFKDRALALPPLNTTLTRRMIERTKIYTALKGVRGRKPVDLAALEQLIVRFSQLIVEQPWIKELDINPLLASPERLLALDARVVVFDREVTEDQLPRLAIRPYPTQYISTYTAKDGTTLTIRPIRAEDEPALVDFHHTLSDRSVYLRYMHPMQLIDRITHERLSRIAHSDYDREIILVAERPGEEEGSYEIVGAGRISKMHGFNVGRFSVLISDCCQGMGIGRELMRQVVEVARAEKLERLEAIITPDNQPMLRIVEKLGFRVSPTEDGSMMKAELDLQG
jgi:acetyltransferase